MKGKEMTDYPRRKFLSTLAGLVATPFLEPVCSLARDIKPIRIKNVDVFRIEIPTPSSEVKRGLTNKYLVAKVDTDAGVRGYAFSEFLRATLAPEPGGWEYAFDGPSKDLLQRVIRPALVGKDLFAIEEHLKAGLVEWGGLEPFGTPSARSQGSQCISCWAEPRTAFGSI